ncbi:hypothetical protein GKODMF_01410 [Candidatus Electrothrix gigas]
MLGYFSTSLIFPKMKKLRIITRLLSEVFLYKFNIFRCLFISIKYKNSTPLKILLRPIIQSIINSNSNFDFIYKKSNNKNPLFFDMAFYSSTHLERLYNKTKGLHQQFPLENKYSYSILIPVYKPQPLFFKQAILSALTQTAPSLEVLIGFDGEQDESVYKVIDKIKAENPKFKNILKSFKINRTENNGGGISNTTNFLANKASNHFLVLMDHDDWIRPDLLYRYEQILRSNVLGKNKSVALYCDELKIDLNNKYIDNSLLRKPSKVHFPYFFINYICHCLLIEKSYFDKVRGLRPEVDGTQDFDLCLRLSSEGVNFHNIPFPLYAWRSHPQSTAMNINKKKDITARGVKAFRDYVQNNNLNWKVEKGLIESSYRGIPNIDSGITPSVHIVIPFKDQKDLTLKSIKSIQSQEGIETNITLVNNYSEDNTLLNEIKGLDVELLNFDDAFNYSMINNFAVYNSKFSNSSKYVLFLNNDVELEKDALLEMYRWVIQPDIGIVGCYLEYPNELVQHGGIDLKDDSNGKMQWCHSAKLQCKTLSGTAQLLRTCDAVTAACALVDKKAFLEVGGFDEMLYPIAFSDTNLIARLRKKGYLCMYTPYARGIHYESISRQKGDIEDIEGSRWLHESLDLDMPRDSLFYSNP